MLTSPSANPDGDVWSGMPTETEVYILPDGQVIIADLPAELALQLDHLGLADDTESIGPQTADDCNHPST